MAGKYIELLNPGYSTLWTRDLPYAPGSGEAADLNPFNPQSARPLVEGEWLRRAVGGMKWTRGGNNAVGVPGTPDDEGMVPEFLYFQEEGRYDAQATKMAHCVIAPFGYEVRTKLGSTGGALAENDAVSVWDWDGPAGAWGIVRRTVAKQAAGYVIGRVTRVFGTNDFSFLYMPGSTP
jgi:hypothetical protein